MPDSDDIKQLKVPPIPSEPPSVKLVAARGAAWQVIIAQLTELLGVFAITYALCAGKLSENVFAYLFISCLTGRAAQQIGSAIRGKPVQPLPTTTLVGMGVLVLGLLRLL